MRSDIIPGAIFPDSDHTAKRRKLSEFTRWVREERPVDIDTGAKFIRLSDIVAANVTSRQ
jgi:hypothetical protein